MSGIKSYGRRPVKKEKSYITHFFDGEDSPENSLFNKSSKSELFISEQDLRDKRKITLRSAISQSPNLFNESYKQDSFEKVSMLEQQRLIKKHVKKKHEKINPKINRNARKRPKKMEYKDPKINSCNQWSEFDNHNFTVEKVGIKKYRKLYSENYLNTDKCFGNLEPSSSTRSSLIEDFPRLSDLKVSKTQNIETLKIIPSDVLEKKNKSLKNSVKNLSCVLVSDAVNSYDDLVIQTKNKEKYRKFSSESFIKKTKKNPKVKRKHDFKENVTNCFKRKVKKSVRLCNSSCKPLDLLNINNNGENNDEITKHSVVSDNNVGSSSVTKNTNSLTQRSMNELSINYNAEIEENSNEIIINRIDSAKNDKDSLTSNPVSQNRNFLSQSSRIKSSVNHNNLEAGDKDDEIFINRIDSVDDDIVSLSPVSKNTNISTQSRSKLYICDNNPLIEQKGEEVSIYKIRSTKDSEKPILNIESDVCKSSNNSDSLAKRNKILNLEAKKPNKSFHNAGDSKLNSACNIETNELQKMLSRDKESEPSCDRFDSSGDLFIEKRSLNRKKSNISRIIPAKIFHSHKKKKYSKKDSKKDAIFKKNASKQAFTSPDVPDNFESCHLPDGKFKAKFTSTPLVKISRNVDLDKCSASFVPMSSYKGVPNSFESCHLCERKLTEKITKLNPVVKIIRNVDLDKFCASHLPLSSDSKIIPDQQALGHDNLGIVQREEEISINRINSNKNADILIPSNASEVCNLSNNLDSLIKNNNNLNLEPRKLEESFLNAGDSELNSMCNIIATNELPEMLSRHTETELSDISCDSFDNSCDLFNEKTSLNLKKNGITPAKNFHSYKTNSTKDTNFQPVVKIIRNVDLENLCASHIPLSICNKIIGHDILGIEQRSDKICINRNNSANDSDILMLSTASETCKSSNKSYSLIKENKTFQRESRKPNKSFHNAEDSKLNNTCNIIATNELQEMPSRHKESEISDTSCDRFDNSSDLFIERASVNRMKSKINRITPSKSIHSYKKKKYTKKDSKRDSIFKNNASKQAFTAPVVSDSFESCHVLDGKLKGKITASTPVEKMYRNVTLDKFCASPVLMSSYNKIIAEPSASLATKPNFVSQIATETCSSVLAKENVKHSNTASLSNIVTGECRKSHLSVLSLLCTPGRSVNLQCLKVDQSAAPKRSFSLLNKSSSCFSPSVRNEQTDEVTMSKLLQLCNQTDIASFTDIYDWSKLKVRKIGEGTYGEVFTINKPKCSVLKIIPISQNKDQDSYQNLQNMLSEIKISKCLSDLRSSKYNQTKNFIKLNRASIVCGQYPSELIDAWDGFSEAKSSYNNRPNIFGDNQLFAILDLEYGGKDMTCFMLRNSVEAESILKQITVSLAVAEEEFLFEHRDLHLGNILIQRNSSKNISYKLRGHNITFPSHGLQATIIDFTLSRLHKDGCIYFNDLAADVSLFNQTGDYQFEIYRSMKRHLENHWHECSFYSNILWLKFLCVKMKDCEYSRPSTKAHKKGLEAIELFKTQLEPCSSALTCLASCGISTIHFEKNPRDLKTSKKSILISRNSLQKSKLSIC